MPKISKRFRIATEGATCDGRTISRQDILDMAATYDRKTYSARVNMEHIRGFSADPPFCAYGDVADGVATQEDSFTVGGKTEKRLGLYAQIEALDNLVAVNAKGQKLYPSIEINPNFAASGKAYLQGLAITDSPASLGTEILAFAAGQGDNNPFASRKQSPGNLFSAVDDGIVLEFTELASPAASEAEGAFAAMKSFFTGLMGTGTAPVAPAAPAAPVTPAAPIPPDAANDNFAQLVTGMSKMAAGLETFSKDVTARFATIEAAQGELKTTIETTDKSSFRRVPASGGSAAAVLTDF